MNSELIASCPPELDQLLSLKCILIPLSFLSSTDFSLVTLNRQTRVAYDGAGRGRGTFRGGAAGRGGASGRGGMSTANYNYLLDPEKPPPPGYICYRCGQKGKF